MTTRIKEALEAGKAIHCRTEDEARRLFEAMGWGYRGYEWPTNANAPPDETVYYHDKTIARSAVRYERGREIIPFSTLARSRLADALGVEEGQEFTYKDYLWRYKIGADGRLYDERDPGWQPTTDGEHICDMINHPEEITPCPVWSDNTIEDARAAARLYGEKITKVCKADDGQPSLITVHNTYIEVGCNRFKDVRPGQTVQLSAIK